MKKRVLALFVITLLSLPLCACQQKTDRGSFSSSPDLSDIHLSDSASVPFESFPAVQESGSDAHSGESDGETSQNDVSENDSSETEVSGKTPEQSSAAKATDDTSSVTLPEGVTRAGMGKLKFTSSVLSLNVTFPEEFCVLNTDISPEYGIYLQNAEGTATLLLASVTDNTLTYRQMSDYLHQQFPDAKVSINDRKEVLCRIETNDLDGHPICILQKIKVRIGGYNQVVLCCSADTASSYTHTFNDIAFT